MTGHRWHTALASASRRSRLGAALVTSGPLPGDLAPMSMTSSSRCSRAATCSVAPAPARDRRPRHPARRDRRHPGALQQPPPFSGGGLRDARRRARRTRSREPQSPRSRPRPSPTSPTCPTPQTTTEFTPAGTRRCCLIQRGSLSQTQKHVTADEQEHPVHKGASRQSITETTVIGRTRPPASRNSRVPQLAGAAIPPGLVASARCVVPAGAGPDSPVPNRMPLASAPTKVNAMTASSTGTTVAVNAKL